MTMLNNTVLSSEILSAASAQMTAGKSTGFTMEQMYVSRLDSAEDRDSCKIRFNTWKTHVESLYLTARKYYFAVYRNAVTEDMLADVRKTMYECLQDANINDIMKYMIPDNCAVHEVILALVGGTEKKNIEIGQYMPAPKSVNAFRGAFERWLVRFVLDIEQWTSEKYDEYNERIKVARKAQKEAKKAEYQSIISKAKECALKMGIWEEETEETITRFCKTTKENKEIARLLALWLAKKAGTARKTVELIQG